MKKLISVLLAVVMCLSLTTFVGAEDTAAQTIVLTIDSPIMTVDGVEAEIDPGRGTAPAVVDGRTILPVRAVVEAMGGTVIWDSAAPLDITLTYGENIIELTIDSSAAYLNGEEQTLDVAPVSINDRTFFPIRFIAESFGWSVAWNGDDQRVTITKAAPQEEPAGRTLIAYFSRTGENYSVGYIDIGNTARIAGYIGEVVDADVFEILAEEPYPDVYDEATARARQEQNDNARPAFVGEIDNIDQYDTVFIGYPIWYGTMPMIMNTFLETYDLSGKTVIPFSTNEGSGWGSSLSDLGQLCPNSEILDGFSTRGSNAENARENVIEWLAGFENI